MVENIVEFPVEQLHSRVLETMGQGYRFVTMTCTDLGESYDLLYHFDKDYRLRNLRLNLPKGKALPSISGILFAAVVVENEIKDMFGLNVEGLAIDYGGRFLLAENAPKAPLSKMPAGLGVDVRMRETTKEGGDNHGV